jgi:RNA polymerase primary sigma factor
MFGIILTSRSSPAPCRRPNFDRIYRFPGGEVIRPEDQEPQTAAGPSPALRIVAPESGRSGQDHLGRARRLLASDLTYVHHPSFDDPGAHHAILAPEPEPLGVRAPEPSKPAAYRDSFLSCYSGAPVLSREQEVHLFRRMNYLKSLAARLRDRIDLQRPAAADLDELERLQAEALKMKNRIVEANLRLVIAIVKNRARPGYDLSERVSDGNLALLLAVDRFDCARGNRFCTYATWAILNELARYDRRSKRHRNRRSPLHEDSLGVADTAGDEYGRDEEQDRRRATVACLLDRLDQRERRILASRHGLGGGPEQTLSQIGRDLGISKERVRQIESRAQAKLRKFARLAALQPSEL